MVRQPKQVLALVVGAIACAAAYTAVKGLFHRPEPAPRSMERLGQLADALNKTLPRAVDKETEWVSTTGLTGMFVYHYRLTNYAAADLDKEKLIQSLRAEVTNSACTTPETRDTFLKRGIAVRYSYADKERTYLGSIDVTPKDCGL